MTLSEARPATEPLAGPVPEKARDRPHWGWLAAFLVLIVGLLANAFEGAMHFNGPPLDGPFQLFNALRRIADGQRLGDTWEFFHGPGVPYLFFLPFTLGGGSFLASEMTRQFISVVLMLATTPLVFRAWTGSWRSAIPLAVTAVIVMIEFRLNAVFLPMNSMLGVRSTMPLLIGVHLLLRRPGWRADVERGALLGLALLLGTEQGIASVAALAIVMAIVALRRREWRPQATAFVVPLAMAIAIYVLFVVGMAGPSNALGVIRFNFSDVPRDQFWYFGGPPNPFLSRWREIVPLLEIARWWLVIGTALVITLRRFWRHAADPGVRAPIAEGFLMIYGVISMASMLGTFVAVYAEPAVRVSVFLCLIALHREWPRWKPELARRIPHLVNRLPAIAIGLLLVATAVREPATIIRLIRTPLHVILAHVQESQGSTLSADWRDTQERGLAVIEDARRALGRTPVVWSTYAGLLEWKTGVFHPYTDYIIHALGPARRAAYAKRFIAAHPDVVQTIRPGYTPYEEWLEVNHWNFYSELLKDYEVVDYGPWSLFWMRRTGPAPRASSVVVNTAVPEGRHNISVAAHVAPDSIGLFVVRLKYRVHNPLAKVPVLGGLPRFLIEVGGGANEYPVSLAPYERERTFPVVVHGPSTILLNARVESLLGVGSLTIDSIRVERVPLSVQNGAWAQDFLRPLEAAAAAVKH